MVSVCVNEVCAASNKAFQKICMSLMDRFFERYTFLKSLPWYNTMKVTPLLYNSQLDKLKKERKAPTHS
jgi:hypothetical protein